MSDDRVPAVSAEGRRLTVKQIGALQAAEDGFDVQKFGSKLMSRLPNGVTMRQLDALEDRGLIKVNRTAPFTLRYVATPAGRAALATHRDTATKGETNG